MRRQRKQHCGRQRRDEFDAVVVHHHVERRDAVAFCRFECRRMHHRGDTSASDVGYAVCSVMRCSVMRVSLLR